MANGKKEKCDHTPEVCRGQIRFLEEEIKAHKWIMSLSANRDIGPAAAELDYCETQIKRTGQLFRTYYCHHMCTERENCGVEGFAVGVEDHIYKELKEGRTNPQIQLILDHIGITQEEYVSSYHRYAIEKAEQ